MAELKRQAANLSPHNAGAAEQIFSKLSEAQLELDAAEKKQRKDREREQARVDSAKTRTRAGRAGIRAASAPARIQATANTLRRLSPSSGVGLSAQGARQVIAAFTRKSVDSKELRNPRYIRETLPKVADALREWYPAKIGSYRTGGVTVKPRENVGEWDTALRIAATWDAINGGPLSPVIVDAMRKGAPVLGTVETKMGSKSGGTGKRIKIPIMVPNTNYKKNGEPVEIPHDQSRGVKQGWTRTYLNDADGNRREVILPVLYNSSGQVKGKLPANLAQKASEGARYVADLADTQRAKDRAKLRGRVFANPKDRKEFITASRAARQVDKVLQVLQFAGMHAKSEDAAERAGWKVRGGVITIPRDRLQSMDPKERAFWERYARELDSLDDSLTNPKDRAAYDTQTKAQKALEDARKGGGIVVAPAVLRTLAVGLLSQASGRGVPQAFEARELADGLGKNPTDVFQWFRDMSAQTRTSRMALNTWLNGEELRALTLDPSTAQMGR